MSNYSYFNQRDQFAAKLSFQIACVFTLATVLLPSMFFIAVSIGYIEADTSPALFMLLVPLVVASAAMSAIYALIAQRKSASFAPGATILILFNILVLVPGTLLTLAFSLNA